MSRVAGYLSPLRSTGVKLRVLLVLPLLACCLPVALSAQSATDSGPAPPPDRRIIRAIQLERRDIFDPHETSWLARVANALHIETRAPTVRRELLFRVGEPYDSARVAESERNLRALGVFRKVQIDSIQTDSGRGHEGADQGRVEHAGGLAVPQRGRRGRVHHRDGGGQPAGHGLVRVGPLPEDARTARPWRSASGGPDSSRDRWGSALGYENRSDGRLNLMALEQPFYSLTSPYGFRVEAEDRDERVLRFFDGSADAQDTLSRRYTLVRASAAWALRRSSEGFLRLGLAGPGTPRRLPARGIRLAFPRIGDGRPSVRTWCGTAPGFW